MARWNDERLGMLADGIRLCFSRWTALQLAVDNEWGGRDSLKKSQQLIQDVVSFLTQTKGTLDIDDLEDLLEDALSKSFNTDLDDGSHEEVAEIVMLLNEECGEGNYERVKSMAQSASSDAKAHTQSICDDLEKNSSEEKEELDHSASHDVLEVSASTPETMDVDKPAEGDWQVVQSRKRKGKGGKRPV